MQSPASDFDDENPTKVDRTPTTRELLANRARMLAEAGTEYAPLSLAPADLSEVRDHEERMFFASMGWPV